MSFFALIFKVIPYLVPFLREMLLGKKTWRQAFRDNRGKTLLAFIVVVSVVFNLLLVTKASTLAYRYLEVVRANEALKNKVSTLEKAKAPVEGSSRHPIVNNTEVATEIKKEAHSTAPAKAPVKPDTNLTEEVKSDFDRIRQREAAEH
jgi:hypothetical protein